MGVCEVCGNHYKNTIKVMQNNQTHEYDCFQCAIHSLAPLCSSCSCRVIGQGIEKDGFIYCGQHCLRMVGRMRSTDELNLMP